MPKTALDPFFATSSEPNFAGRHAAVVTPSDTQDLPVVTKQLWINNTGTAAAVVAVVMADDPDGASVLLGAPVGVTQYTAQIRRVMVTGTTPSFPGTITANWG